MTDEDLLAPLVQALDQGVRAGTDLRRVVVTPLLEWDGESNRGLVSLDGGDPTWLLAAADTYWPDVVDTDVIVLRNEWTGRGACILGPKGQFAEPPVEPDLLPARGTVTAIPGAGRVKVNAAGAIVTAATGTSYVDPAVGDVVVLNWASDGSEAIAVCEVGWTPAKPSTPGEPSLSRSGTTVTVSWPRPSDVDSTRVRWRYGSGAWSVRTGLTGGSTTISVAEGRTRQVQIAQSNAGGTSSWSDTATIAGPAPAPPPSRPSGSGGGGSGGAAKYETVTKTISPTSTGTYRHAVHRWDDWNRGRYGYPYTLYQGSRYGSGDLSGLATYGTRVKDLRAVEILKIEVRLVDARLGERTLGQPIRIVVAENGSRPNGAPTTGATVTTTSLGKGDSKWLRLDLGPGSLDNWRTGLSRGLVVNGSAYRGLRGKGTAGMTLRVTYRRRV
ncbi:hypothetical protein [Isoptericola sp. NPDC055881]